MTHVGKVSVVTNIIIAGFAVAAPDLQQAKWLRLPDINFSSEIIQPADTDGKLPHLLSVPKREEPSLRREAESRYFPLKL